MEIMDHVHRFIIGYDQAIESELAAQNIGQDVPRGRHDFTIQLGIGIHDGAKTCQADCSLERRHVNVINFPPSHVDWGAVEPAL
jgi:hypothetical protein